MLRHLRNPQLVATYAVGFGTLFNFIATFTYINFVLAAPPYSFSATLLGAIFFVYLLGAAVTPMTGRFIHRFGRRPFMIGNVRGLDVRDPADAAPVAGGDRRRACGLRGLRPDRAGDLDRLCHADGARKAARPRSASM